MKNKSIVVLILSSLVVFAGCGNDMSNTGGEGSGQTSCNISISSYEEFDKIRENLSCNYTLTANIDFEMRTNFEPIGTENKPFTGVLDGAGYTIQNVKIEKKGSSYVGVIGYAKDGTIKGLTFENVKITGKGYVGVIGASSGTIMNVYVKSGTIEGHGGSPYYVGGLVGENGGPITNSYSAATVKGNSYIGGLAGSNSGTIENSYSSATVKDSYYYVGGLVGRNSGTIENSYSSSTVKGSSTVGGLAGSNSGTIENSYATGAVTTTSKYKGGLVGDEDYSKKVSNSYYDKEGTKQMTGKGTGVSGKANIVKRDNKYYDTLGTEDITTDDVEIFKGWDFASVWVFTERQWPKLAWQTN